MSAEKKALGKGLSALISDNTIKHITDNEKGLLYIEANALLPNPYQPRKDFHKEELDELAQSIKVHGILQPIIVRTVGDKYEIIAGERRLQASKIAGISKVPCIVREYTNQESFELALIENIQRENLSPLEEAQAYERMAKEFNSTQESIAQTVGKSRAHIANTLRLLSLPDDVKKLLNSRKLTAGHARSIINAPNISELATKIVNDNMSVREVENYVRESKNQPGSPKKGKKRHSRLIREGAFKHFQKDTDLLEIEKMLTDNINMPVYINDTLDGGQVVIEFKCLEELDWLIQRLGAEKLNF